MPERSFSSVDFIKGLEQFSHYKYSWTDEPFDYLFQFVGQKSPLYEQFSSLLIDDAVSKGVSRDQVNNSLMDYTSQNSISMNHAQEIRKLIDKSVRDNRGNQKVLLFPIMCGIGKSSAVSCKMEHELKSKSGQSLLIVTDNKERLNSYIKPSANSDMCDFFARDDIKNRYCIFNAETKAEALRRADHTQILLMTTQRFMHLSKEDLDRFTTYNGKRRSMIIIDEQPEVIQFETVLFSTIANVLIAFIQGLRYSNDPSFAAEKAWCIGLWQKITEACNKLLDQIDRESDGRPGYHCFLRPNDLEIAEEDEKRFMRFVRENRKDLDTYEGGDEFDKVTASIEAVFEMIHHGALFCSRDGRRNQKPRFKLYMDRIGQFDVPGTKIVILDGTASISPMYKFHKDRYKLINGTWRLRRSLNNLHIHVLDYKTGRDAMKNLTGGYPDAIIQDIRKRTKPYLRSDDSPIVFTYKLDALQNRFKEAFGIDHVSYLGNLKGFNTYNTANVVVQVGMNQLPLENYYLMSLIDDEETRERFLQMTPQEQAAAIASAISSQNSSIKTMMTDWLLADTEQNFFRGNIRELVGKEYHFFLYCSHRYYQKVIQAMSDRYRQFDGDVQLEELSLADRIASYMARGRSDKLGNRIIRTIFSFRVDQEFHTFDVYALAGITYEQYKQVVRDTPVIKELLQHDKIGENTYQNRFQMPSDEILASRSIDQSNDLPDSAMYDSYQDDDEDEDDFLPF